MAVDRGVDVGTPVMTRDGVKGEVLKSYPGTGVVTIKTPEATLTMLRHELYYDTIAQTEFPALGWQGE